MLTDTSSTIRIPHGYQHQISKMTTQHSILVMAAPLDATRFKPCSLRRRTRSWPRGVTPNNVPDIVSRISDHETAQNEEVISQCNTNKKGKSKSGRAHHLIIHRTCRVRRRKSRYTHYPKYAYSPRNQIKVAQLFTPSPSVPVPPIS